MNPSTKLSCQDVGAELCRSLDGSASRAVHEHLASCDACRDAEHERELARCVVRDAASDFELPEDLLARLQQASASPEPAIVPSSAAASQSGRLRSLLGFGKRWGMPLVALAVAALVVRGRAPESTSPSDPELSGPPWRGVVEKLVLRDGKLEVCAPSGAACKSAREGDAVPAGSRLRTDRGCLAEITFADGSRLSLDRDTTLELSSRGRGGELIRGRVVADVAPHAGWGARFAFEAGYAEVLGTKFSLQSEQGSAVVNVARGEVRLSDSVGHDVRLGAGEEGRVDAGSLPVAGVGRNQGEALGWSEVVAADEDDTEEKEPDERPRALGELRAKKPGERDERAGLVRLASHAVRVKISGSVARTEVEEVFENQTDDVLEGIFRFPLPPDAKIERLALETDGKLVEGAFVDRDRASAIWRGAIVNAAPQLRREIKDEIVWVPGPWRDPALLEWQRGGRFELRIFPIPRRGSRRVVLAYSELVAQSAAVRHYSYPLAFDGNSRQQALDFSLDVQLRGNDPSFRVRTPGWEMQRRRDDGNEELHWDSRSFVPSGDFRLDYALEGRSAELSAWAYRDGAISSANGQPYFALLLRPQLPKTLGRGAPRAVALVIDSSRSMFGENYRRASSLAARLSRELDAVDRVTVLACDSTCRQLPGGLRATGAVTAREIRRFLQQEAPAGASDVSYAVVRGFAALGDSEREPHVVYIGDAAATVGPTRPSTLEAAVRAELPATGHVTAVGVGPDSDGDSLAALARGGAGEALPYVPGTPAFDVALATLSSLRGAALRNVRLELPEGVSLVAPARLDRIVLGSETLVTGRANTDRLRGEAVLRGDLNGRPFEQRYPLDVTASEYSGNAFVPRLFAAARIGDLERDGSDDARREAVELSTTLGVGSRFTSLLVLESEAMYRAFGITRAHKASEYTADLDAEGSSSSGELALSDDEPQAAGSETEARRGDVGFGGGLSSRAAPKAPEFAPPPAARPAPSAPLGPPNDFRADKPAEKKARSVTSDDFVFEPLPEPRPRARPMIPMRRVWQRHGEIWTDRFVPSAAGDGAQAAAERELVRDDSRRQALKTAFALKSAAGELAEAERLAQRWIEKEPLDPEALTALADVEARQGRREAAIRLLGSVLDVRPLDTAAHRRLSRLERWAGHAELACRHEIAIAEGRSDDLPSMLAAVRCSRQLRLEEIAEALVSAATPALRRQLEQGLASVVEEPKLSGDLRLEAIWSGGSDVDLALIDTLGHRISWLGAATRSVISALDVNSSQRESLGLRGAAPGEYVVELTRGDGVGSAQGELSLSVAGATRRIPFRLDGDRKVVALVRISMQSTLVPL